jgi:hypothetical protein
MDLAVVGDALAKVEVLPDETLVNIFSYRKRITDYLKAVDRQVYLRMISNGKLPGLKAIRGRSTRKWNEELPVEEVLRSHGIEPVKTSIKGLGEIKTLLKETGMKAAEADEVVNSVSVKPEGKIKIVPESASGEPIALDTGINLLVGLDDEENSSEE